MYYQNTIMDESRYLRVNKPEESLCSNLLEIGALGFWDKIPLQARIQQD